MGHPWGPDVLRLPRDGRHYRGKPLGLRAICRSGPGLPTRAFLPKLTKNTPGQDAFKT
jgi:hypothetical protein